MESMVLKRGGSEGNVLESGNTHHAHRRGEEIEGERKSSHQGISCKEKKEGPAYHSTRKTWGGGGGRCFFIY